MLYGGFCRRGYGRITIGKGRTVDAHRAAWEVANGKIPSGLHVCHTCDVRNCINVAHLFLGTNAENVADKMAKGRWRGRPDTVTVDEIETFRALRASGLSYRAIAKKTGRGRETVRQHVGG